MYTLSLLCDGHIKIGTGELCVSARCDGQLVRVVFPASFADTYFHKISDLKAICEKESLEFNSTTVSFYNLHAHGAQNEKKLSISRWSWSDHRRWHHGAA